MRADPNGPLALVLQSIADVALPMGLGIALLALATALIRKFK